MLNTVPFDKLGPGQSGRLAYQVLGQDGPIMNPQNIRYLSPDSVELPANAMKAGALGLATGLAGANLICSFLNLGVSVYIASQVAGLHRKMDCLQETMNRIEPKVDYIVSKVDRIDIQVAENNLRHALDYVLRQAVSSEGVDLRALSGLCNDFSKFSDSLSLGFFTKLSLGFFTKLFGRVDPAVRAEYDALKYEVRMAGWSALAEAKKADPTMKAMTHEDEVRWVVDAVRKAQAEQHRTWTADFMLNFDLQLSSDIRGRLQEIHDFVYGLRKLVAQKYNIAVDGDPERIITTNPTDDYFSPFVGGNLEILVKATMTISSADSKKLGLIDFDDYLPEPHYKIFEGEDTEATEQGLYDLGCAWLHHTDSGLLWRTWTELDAIAKGYDEYFWPQLKEATPCGFDQIDVVTDLALIEAG